MPSGLPRSVDLILSLAALVLLAPVLVAVSLLIAVSSGLPVLFRQVRVGQNGRHFLLYKFRTMRPSTTGPHVTAGDDGRITPLGRLLRRTKLDELPELWNVARGDMSLVGPRPEAAAYVKRDDVRWAKVLEARPGITDPVTLTLRNEEALLNQVGGDRELFYLHSLQPWKLRGYVAYLEHRNWRTDVGVLLRTLVAVARPSRVPPPTIETITGRSSG